MLRFSISSISNFYTVIICILAFGNAQRAVATCEKLFSLANQSQMERIIGSGYGEFFSADWSIQVSGKTIPIVFQKKTASPPSDPVTIFRLNILATTRLEALELYSKIISAFEKQTGRKLHPFSIRSDSETMDIYDMTQAESCCSNMKFRDLETGRIEGQILDELDFAIHSETGKIAEKLGAGSKFVLSIYAHLGRNEEYEVADLARTLSSQLQLGGLISTKQ